jgi:hypothetical protein
MAGLCSGDVICLLWSTNWVFISQKTAFFIVTAVKISNLTWSILLRLKKKTRNASVGMADFHAEDWIHVSWYEKQAEQKIGREFRLKTSKFLSLCGRIVSCVVWLRGASRCPGPGINSTAIHAVIMVKIWESITREGCGFTCHYPPGARWMGSGLSWVCVYDSMLG